jgi:hypothetical protein
MILARPLVRFAVCAALTLFAACGSDETQATDDHTPVSFTVLVDDVPASSPLTLPSGQTVRVRLKFVNAAGEDLDDVEGSHFAGLTFSPTSLATAVRVTDHNFQFDVTGGTPGTGTVQVGYGHDAQADEHTFPAAPMTVTEAP